MLQGKLMSPHFSLSQPPQGRASTLPALHLHWTQKERLGAAGAKPLCFPGDLFNLDMEQNCGAGYIKSMPVLLLATRKRNWEVQIPAQNSENIRIWEKHQTRSTLNRKSVSNPFMVCWSQSVYHAYLPTMSHSQWADAQNTTNDTFHYSEACGTYSAGDWTVSVLSEHCHILASQLKASQSTSCDRLNGRNPLIPLWAPTSSWGQRDALFLVCWICTVLSFTAESA